MSDATTTTATSATTTTATAPPTWIADLPEDIRGNPAIASFKGNDWKEVGPALAKSFIETKAMTGRKAYDLPADDWKPEQWANWHKTIGVPETPDKYSAADAAMLQKAGIAPEVAAAAMKRFHEIGLTPRQKKALFDDWYVAEAAKGAEIEATTRQATLEKDIQTLKTEFGDKYDANIGVMKSVLKKFGSEDLAKWADESGLGNNPGLVRMLVKIGHQMLESSALGGGRDLGPDAQKAAAMKEIDSMMSKRVSDPAYAKAFEDPKSAERQRWAELHSLAYPKAA